MKFRLAASTRASFRAIKRRRYRRIRTEGHKGFDPSSAERSQRRILNRSKSGNEDRIFHNKIVGPWPEVGRPVIKTESLTEAKRSKRRSVHRQTSRLRLTSYPSLPSLSSVKDLRSLRRS